jgi:hypothetical protein
VTCTPPDDEVIIVARKAANRVGKGGGAAPVVSPPCKCYEMETGAGAPAAEEGGGVLLSSLDHGTIELP